MGDFISSLREKNQSLLAMAVIERKALEYYAGNGGSSAGSGSSRGGSSGGSGSSSS